MPGFSMTPATGFNPQAPDEFPTGLQFQSNGENLGLPDVDTVDFTTGLSITRGSGSASGKVTVSATGGAGGGAAVAVFQLAGANPGSFDSAMFGDWSPATELLANAIASWDSLNQALLVPEAGFYAIKVECKVEAVIDGSSATFPRDDILYGAEVDHAVINGRTQLGFNSSALGLNASTYVQWIEDFTVQTDDADVLVQPRIYCKCYNSADGRSSSFSAVVTVTKLS